MSEAITIGVDHGYATMKTTHCAFPTGLVEYEHEPYTQKDVLEYGSKFYVVGSGRQPLQKGKTATKDYYLLTLAAIAKELAFRDAEPASTIHLAAGLPLTSFGRDKKKFQGYLLRDRQPVSFRYEGIAYTVTIAEVSLFPQGYAAVLTQREPLDEPSVIVADIGGWTVDLMRLDNRIPNAATCRSLELGMIRCLDEIAEQVHRSLGLSMTAAQIESALRGEVGSVGEQAREIIHREAGAYVRRLLSSIAESGLDARAMPAVFLGGGAALLKRHVSAADGLCRPLILLLWGKPPLCSKRRAWGIWLTTWFSALPPAATITRPSTSSASMWRQSCLRLLCSKNLKRRKRGTHMSDNPRWEIIQGDALNQITVCQQDEEQQAAQASRQREMEGWLDQQPMCFTEYDDTLTRRFIAQITVMDAETIQVKIRDTDVVIESKIR